MADIGSTLSKYTSASELSNLLESDKAGIYFAKTYLALDGVTDDYDDLYALINTTINGADSEIWFKDGTCLIGTSITIPSNVKLKSLNGGVLKPESGVVITGSNAKIEAGIYQIFDLSASGTTGLAGTWRCTEYYPQWFGAVGNDTTDDTTAMQLAFNFSSAGKLHIPKGTYKITSTLTIPSYNDKSITRIEGYHFLDSIINYYGTTPCINARGLTGNRKYFQLKDIYIKNDATNANSNVNGIEMEYNNFQSCLERVQFSGFYDTIKNYKNWNITFKSIFILNSDNDGYVSADTNNALVFDGGIINNCANTCITISGRNHVFNGLDFGGGGVKCMKITGGYGITLNSCYFEGPTDVGISIEASSSITINGCNCSTFPENVKLISANIVGGLTINGFSSEIGGSTAAVAGTYGIYLVSVTGFVFNGLSLLNLAMGVYVQASKGEINYPFFAYTTVPIELVNTDAVNVSLKIKSADFTASTLAAVAMAYATIELYDTIKQGTTANRPTTNYIGQQYMDTTLNKLLAWDGAWYDGTGTSV